MKTPKKTKNSEAARKMGESTNLSIKYYITKRISSMIDYLFNTIGNVRLVTVIATVMATIIIFTLKPDGFEELISYSPFEDVDEPIYPEYFKPTGFLVLNSACKIREMQPWDKSVRGYFKSSSLIRCSKRPLLTSIATMKNGSYLLQIENDAISSYKDNEADILSCCYSEITRISESRKKYDAEADNKFRYSQCQSFQNDTLLPNTTEFIRVKCMLKRKNKSAKEIYRDAHAVVPIVPSALQKMKKYGMNVTRPSTKINHGTTQLKSSDRLNILILGIDSVSRLNLRRMMPKTFEYIKQNEWIEMNGYTKIADNTFPNLMAILSGRNVSDIYSHCLTSRTQSLDNCPYIWKKFSDIGYITAYGEDTPNISTFNYLQTGFVEKPTDYYLRPFMLATHSSLTKKKVYGLPVCVGPVAPVDHILNYARRFLHTFNIYNHFSLFWMNSLSHNNPTTAQNLDHRILSFLQDLTDIGTYNNTLVLLLSDHGTRFGDFRHTFMGYYEERLPFFAMWIPEWFRNKYPELHKNVVTNQKRLTSPFDVHLTLRKLLKGDYTSKRKYNAGEQLPACTKCLSLFDKIPRKRSCADAAIEQAWCMCDDFDEIETDTPLITKLGKYVKDIVVNKTKELEREENLNDTVCATWTFNKVIRAHEVTPVVANSDIFRFDPVQRKKYMLLVELNPGKTRFESMIEIIQYPGVDHEVWEVRASPSRLDGYSKFSQCVSLPHLKYYCYCKNM